MIDARCQECGQTIGAGSCTLDIAQCQGLRRGRFRQWGDGPCTSCLTPIGGFHHKHCANEICPFCNGRIASCGCVVIIDSRKKGNWEAMVVR